MLLRPAWDSETDAEDAIDLIAACGQELDEWQKLLVRITLATKGGRLAASEVGALVARQNGKGGWLEAIAIWALFVAGGTTMWTAHELKTSDEAHERIKALIKSNADLEAEVVKWDGGLTGQHIMQLRSGARLVFVARSKSSGRGLSPQRIIFDEAQEFSRLAFRALSYATSAQGARRQLIYTGTVPDESMNSEIWTGVRDRGRAGEAGRLAWAEWTPKDSDNPAVTIDPESWANRAAANPALGTRVLPETVDEEWAAAKAADVDGFLRERLSVWPSSAGGTGILDFDAWSQRKFPLAQPQRPIVLAVETTLDRSQSVLVAVATGPDDQPQIKVLAARPGTAWVSQLVVDVATEHEDVVAVVIDGRAQASGFVEQITPRVEAAYLGTEIVVTSLADMAQACSNALDVLNSGEYRHAGDPSLDAAVRGAVKRTVGDGAWAWDRRKGGPTVAPLVAMTLALWQWKRMTESADPMSQIF